MTLSKGLFFLQAWSLLHSEEESPPLQVIPSLPHGQYGP